MTQTGPTPFVHLPCCPACGLRHLIDLVPAVIERQPVLFDFQGTCRRSGRERTVLVCSGGWINHRYTVPNVVWEGEFIIHGAPQ